MRKRKTLVKFASGKSQKLIIIFAVLSAMALYFYASNEEPPIIVETVEVTVPEGFNVFQIATAIERAGIVSREDFLKVAEAEEGFLFPDTYEFYKESNPDLIKEKMKENFHEKAASLIEQAEAQARGIRDVIIMASLLEEEAATDKDRKLIAGILWKRLDKGMLLQVDAALTYATGKSSLKLTTKDLSLDSPYNTYKYKGLPVGPISNPGLGAIEAALNPTQSSYWFYLSDSAGVMHYSKTFDEHKLNKFKYLR